MGFIFHISLRVLKHYFSCLINKRSSEKYDFHSAKVRTELLDFKFVFVFFQQLYWFQNYMINNVEHGFFSAIGQIMLYVDGMNGVIQHNETIQWLYQLLSSKVSFAFLYSIDTASCLIL